MIYEQSIAAVRKRHELGEEWLFVSLEVRTGHHDQIGPIMVTLSPGEPWYEAKFVRRGDVLPPLFETDFGGTRVKESPRFCDDEIACRGSWAALRAFVVDEPTNEGDDGG